MSQQAAFGIPQFTKGDRLAKALDFAGMSVAEMSDYLGISRNTVGNYIAERTKTPRPTLMLWSLRTGVPIEWLESGDAPGAGPDGDDGQPTVPYVALRAA